MKNLMSAIVLSVVLLGTCGCKHLLPSSYEESASTWDSYDDAHQAFLNLSQGETRVQDLGALGFDVNSGANVEYLSYLDVVEIFLSHPAIRLQDLPEGVIECIQTKDSCKAYRISMKEVNKERYGNFWADMFGFRKKVHKTGWSYEILMIVVGERVVYAVESGIPKVDHKEIDKNPLGPLDRRGGDLLERAVDKAF
jgi:hypothetical protein